MLLSSKSSKSNKKPAISAGGAAEIRCCFSFFPTNWAFDANKSSETNRAERNNFLMNSDEQTNERMQMKGNQITK